MNLVQEIDRAIAARTLLPDGQPMLVAVSGGLDSMVLLRVLHALSDQHAWRLVVAHFNHQLRGAESDGDERFVGATAKRLGLECVRERWEPCEPRLVKKFGLEMAARLARHGFFSRAAQRLNLGAIALAHHADDQAELFFLRLFRGAGGEGLAGMKWIGEAISTTAAESPIRLVRPLLAHRKEALRAFAKARRVKFREDSSNTCLDHERNRVRHELLPWLAHKFDPSVVTTALRAMEIVGAEADYTRRAAEDWFADGRRKTFDALHPAVQRQCLRAQLGRLSITPKFELIEQLRLSPNVPVTASAGCVVSRDDDGRVTQQDQLEQAFQPDEIILDLVGRNGEQIFDGVSFHWQIEEGCGTTRPPQAMVGCECFNAGKVGSQIRLRHWRPGDRFQPIGLGRAVKLQDLFTNLKIPAARRRALVVAETAHGVIFWVEGLRISEQFKLDARTRRQLKWRWQRQPSA